MHIEPVFLHKAIALLLSPVGLCLVCMAVMLRWPRRLIAVVPLIVLGLFSWPPFADTLLGSLEKQYPQRTVEQCPVSDAAFPLGGILTESSAVAGPDEFTDASDRFERAVALYQACRARMLVFSNVRPPAPGLQSEGERLRQIAIGRGVPASAILLTAETINTASEADALAVLARQQHWKRVLLVTSAYHMPRAMRLFRRAPAEIVPVPVGYEARGVPLRGTGFVPDRWMPQAGALFHSERALHEYGGTLFYALTR
jgi:uncharacterized SAM-binding protein YcdF (DUF218 family)